MAIFSILSDSEIPSVLALQKENLRPNLSRQECEQQGFLTISHDAVLLKEMNGISPSIVAKDGNAIAGFCLAMTREFEQAIPILVPMFEVFHALHYKNKKLDHYNYIVVGQVCVASSYRGRGIFDGLYHAYREKYGKEYDMAVTEVNAKNLRSMAAHTRVGFEFLHQYTAPDGEVWNVIVWNWC